MVEVHPRPDEAKSDGEQSLTLDQFADMSNALGQIHGMVQTLIKDPFAMAVSATGASAGKH
jgi:3-deoxy-D-manno-octulosonic acid (KDO) 8-phosphate synthase